MRSAAGLEIAMACDVRFAADCDFKIGLPETRLGLLPGNGGSQRLPRIVGASNALMLLASGESINPRSAAALGLVKPTVRCRRGRGFHGAICRTSGNCRTARRRRC